MRNSPPSRRAAREPLRTRRASLGPRRRRRSLRERPFHVLVFDRVEFFLAASPVVEPVPARSPRALSARMCPSDFFHQGGHIPVVCVTVRLKFSENQSVSGVRSDSAAIHAVVIAARQLRQVRRAPAASAALAELLVRRTYHAAAPLWRQPCDYCRMRRTQWVPSQTAHSPARTPVDAHGPAAN